jgi:hypothetical protein
VVGNKTLHTAIDTAQPDWYRVGDKPYPQGNHQHPGSTYTLTIRADTALRGAVARERAGFYAAEARLNNAMAEVREFFANQTPPGTAYTNSLALDTGSHQRTVEYQIAPVLGKNLAPPSLTPVGQPFAGLYTILSEYTITSVAKNAIGDQEARLGAQFATNSVSIFQFMAFSENTCDVQNALPMIVSGRIHTNSDLYLIQQRMFTHFYQ